MTAHRVWLTSGIAAAIALALCPVLALLVHHHAVLYGIALMQCVRSSITDVAGTE